MSIYKTVASLNTPAIIYLVITAIVSLALAIGTAMCLKNKKDCDETTTIPVLLFFVIMALALTWLLNLIYSRGYHITAWLLLIFVFPMGFGLFYEDGGDGGMYNTYKANYNISINSDNSE